MPIQINDNGTWRTVQNVWTKVAGQWRSCTSVKTRVAGVWQTVFGGVVQVTDPVEINGPGTLFASVIFKSNGQLTDQAGTVVTSGEWFSGEPQTFVGANFYVRCTSVLVGAFSTQAAAVGTPIRMDSDRAWQVQGEPMGGPPGIVEADFAISPYPSGADIATFTVDLTTLI